MINLLFFLLFLGKLVCIYGQGVSIGSMVFRPDVSAMLEVQVDNKGVLIPRLTTAQRDAIVNTANGLLIQNIDTKCFEWWDAASSQWIPMGYACPPPLAPIVNAASGVTATSFVANWSAVTSATSYFLDVATNSTFTNFVPGYNNLNVGNVTSYNVTGLVCNTQYFYRVRAVNVCGVSPNSNTISVNTSACIVTCLSRQFGGTGIDQAHSIVQTSDGGYAVAGRTNSFGAGGYDFWVLKLALDGMVQWQRTYGGTSHDIAYSIVQTSDGGYAVAGYTFSFGAGERDFWVLKLISDGTIQWQRTYGGVNSDIAYSIIQTSDGGYAVAGYTSSFGAFGSDLWVLKLASDGKVQWQRRYGGTGDDGAFSIIQTSDGGYAVAGLTVSFGAGCGDFWVLNLASDGTVQWQRTYGGANWDYAYSIIQTSDGGYAVAGYTNSFGAGSYDFWVLKLASDGTIQWQRSYGGVIADYASSITQTSDGRYAVAGYMYTFSFGDGSEDFWVLKLNSSEMGPGCGSNSNATIVNTTATAPSTSATVSITTATAPTTTGTTQVTNCTVSNDCPCP